MRVSSAHQGVGLVPLVPDEGQAAAGPEHPGELGQRHVAVEPVEGLGHGDRVERGVGEGEVLGDGAHLGHAGDRPRRTRPAWTADGSAATQLGPGRRQARVSLPVPGGHVEDPAARADAEAADQLVDGLVGVAGPGPLVDVGPVANPPGQQRSSARTRSTSPARGRLVGTRMPS